METEREMYTQIAGVCHCCHYTGAAGGRARTGAHRNDYTPRRLAMKTLFIIAIYIELFVTNCVIGMPASGGSQFEGDAVVSI